MSYPRYVQGTVAKWAKEDCDAITDHVLAGETLSGFLAYPYTYIIRNISGVYDAIDATGTRAFGGSTDEGGIDGGSFNAVFNAAKGSNCTIVLKGNSTYTTTGTLDYSDLSNFRLIGENTSAKIKANANIDNNVLWGAHASKVEFINLDIDGNGVNQANWSNGIMISHLSADCKVIGCIIHDVASGGIVAGYGNGDISGHHIIGNTVYNTGQFTEGDGIGLEPSAGFYSKNWIIKNNTVYNTRRFGIMLYSRAQNSIVEGNHVSQTGLINVGGDGIYLYGATNNRVIGNRITDITVPTSASGITIGDGSTENVVSGNIVDSEALLYGVKLIGATTINNLISNNRIFGITGKYGITENVGATGNMFCGNKLTGTSGLNMSAGSENIGDTSTLYEESYGQEVGTPDVNGDVSVTHNLSDEPDVIFVNGRQTTYDAGNKAVICYVPLENIFAANFKVKCRYQDNSLVTQELTIDWLARKTAV